MKDLSTIKKDRMRYTKNKLAATLCYLAILFNVFYFVNIYTSDAKGAIGTYYYSITIGISVIYNLLFLLIAFLSSESIKNYSKTFSVVIFVMGILQVARIFGIPKQAHTTPINASVPDVMTMGDKQFTFVVIFLCLSAAACITAGVVGYLRAYILAEYKKEIGVA